MPLGEPAVVEGSWLPSYLGRGALARTLSWLPMAVLLILKPAPPFQKPSVEKIVKFFWQEYCTGSTKALPAYICPAVDNAGRSGVLPVVLIE